MKRETMNLVAMKSLYLKKGDLLLAVPNLPHYTFSNPEYATVVSVAVRPINEVHVTLDIRGKEASKCFHADDLVTIVDTVEKE